MTARKRRLEKARPVTWLDLHVARGRAWALSCRLFGASPAYVAGRKAALEGADYSDNPHPRRSEEARAWARGFVDAPTPTITTWSTT